MMKFIRALYHRVIRLSAHKHAVWALAAVSFAESSFFPIPPDALLIPMCIGERKKSFWFATVCTVSSVIGGLCGYAIGYFLYESVGKGIIDFYGLSENFGAMQAKYNEYGGWIIFGKGLTPFPYKIITILSGVMKMNIPVFIVASIFGRAIRFYLVAALLWKYGAPVQEFIERRLGLVTLAFLAVVIGGFLLLRFVI